MDEHAQQWVRQVVDIAGVGAVQVVVSTAGHEHGAWQAQAVLNAVVPQVWRGLGEAGVDRGRFTVKVQHRPEDGAPHDGVTLPLSIQPPRPRLDEAKNGVLDELVEQVANRLRGVNRPTSRAGIWEAYDGEELRPWRGEGPLSWVAASSTTSPPDTSHAPSAVHRPNLAGYRNPPSRAGDAGIRSSEHRQIDL